MKIIISHDVDHLFWSDHIFRDLFIPKWILRNSLYLLKGKIEGRLYSKRIAAIRKDRMNRLAEMTILDKRCGIPSTFFIGMESALSMSYSYNYAKKTVEDVFGQGFDVGVHGVAYDDFGKVRKEYNRLKNIVGQTYSFGVRNHYLRRNERTLMYQEKSGYIYDSSLYGITEPFWVNNILEFPVCLMDSYLIGFGNPSIKPIIKKTLGMLKKAEENNLNIFTILTHDIYYSHLFPTHRDWYQWLVEYLRNQYEITSFIKVLHDQSNKTDIAFEICVDRNKYTHK